MFMYLYVYVHMYVYIDMYSYAGRQMETEKFFHLATCQVFWKA